MQYQSRCFKIAKITIAEDGPYIVENLGKLSNPNGDLEQKDRHALCRCGASKNKPFCDGSHRDINFSGKKERTETYDTKDFDGKNLTVVDNVGICCHAGECVKGAPEAFFKWEGDERISTPDDCDKEKIIEVIKKCPSGSLAYKLDKELYDEYFSEEEIFISKDGPFHVRGSIELDDECSKELISKEHYTLCRCGASKNKPFCDGAHKEAGFKD